MKETELTKLVSIRGDLMTDLLDLKRIQKRIKSEILKSSPSNISFRLNVYDSGINYHGKLLHINSILSLVNKEISFIEQQLKDNRKELVKVITNEFN